MKSLSIAALALLAVPAAGFAQDSQGGLYIGPVIETSFGFGTEEFHYFGSTRPGDALTFAGGIHLRPYRTSRFDLRATAGYSIAASEDSNDYYIGTLTASVMPGVRFAGNWWLSAGVQGHFDPTLRDDDGNDRVSFENALGPTFDLGWHFHGGRVFEGAISAFATLMDYDYGVGEVDADSFGLRFTALFGWSLGREQATVYSPPSQSSPADGSPPQTYPAQSYPAPAPQPYPAQSYSAPTPSTNANVGGTRYRGGQGPAAPVASTPAPAAQPTTPAPQTGIPARTRRAIPLRGRPRLDDAGQHLLPAGTPLRLQSQLQNDSGAWWFVDTDRASGWVPDAEIAR
jgi:hypothetical protein